MAELIRIAIGEISDRALKDFRRCRKLRRVEEKGAKANAPAHTTMALL